MAVAGSIIITIVCIALLGLYLLVLNRQKGRYWTCQRCDYQQNENSQTICWRCGQQRDFKYADAKAGRRNRPSL